ncbi:MAG TPA: type II toxin-antitoxin system HicB family antitoxin [Dehalococcoidia bacterium]|nr:type II toxin-antitoxin system HicB family antitoxin [Dehalococcoidia bacterium]
MASALQKTIKAVIRPGDTHYVAECLEISVVTQGETLDETIANLREAVSLHLDGEDLQAMGLEDEPVIVVTIEVDPQPRVA